MTTRNIVALLLILLLIAPVTAQNDSALPPAVIDTQPFAGVEITRNEPLAIEFNQPMQADSVAIAFDPPELIERVEWTNNNRTVNLTPDGGAWATDLRYDITVTGNAQNGLALPEPYTFALQTPRSLNVAEVSPLPNSVYADVVDSRIVISFDRPVVPLVSVADQANLPTPITIAPVIDGTGEWVNASLYSFTPNSPLPSETNFTVQVADDLTAVNGAGLSEPLTWQFSTAAPRINQLRPTSISDEQGLLGDSGVAIEFTQPIDRASAENAIQMIGRAPSGAEETVTGSFEWDENDTLVTFTPISFLKATYVYRAVVGDGIISAFGGSSLVNPQMATLGRVEQPAVERTYPDPFSVNPPYVGSASITFNVPMNWETFEGNFTIIPEPSGEIVPYVSESNLNLTFTHQPSRTYTITISGDVEDAYGNKLGEDFVLSYDIVTFEELDGAENTDPRPSAIAVVPGDLVTVGTYLDNATIDVRLRDNPTVRYELFNVDVPSLALSSSQRNNQEPAGFLWANPTQLLRTWTQSYTEDRTQIPLTNIDGSDLPLGLYGLKTITTNPHPDDRLNSENGFVFAVANAAITVKSAPHESLVWVTDIASGSPLANVTVTVNTTDGIAFTGVSDADGVVMVPRDAFNYGETTYSWDYSYQPIVITATGDSVYGLWRSRSSETLPTTAGYIYTDRPIYRPGETVYFRGFLRDRDDVTYALDGLPATATAMAGEEQYNDGDTTIDPAFYTEQVSLSDFGMFSGNFVIPNDDAFGYRSVMVLACPSGVESCDDPYKVSIGFEIADFRVPAFDVNVSTENGIIISGDPLNVLVEADYYSGETLSNAGLSYYYYPNFGGFNPINFGDYSFNIARNNTDGNGNPGGNGNGEASTDDNGDFVITDVVETDTILNLYVESTVNDGGNDYITSSTQVTVVPANVLVGISIDGFYFLEGDNLTTNLVTIDPDEATVAEKNISLELIEVRWERKPIAFGRYEWERSETSVLTDTITSDANGEATYSMMSYGAGWYQINATVTDSEGRSHTSSDQFYVTNRDGTLPIWAVRQEEGTYLDWNYRYGYGQQLFVRLTTERTEYAVGDTARVFIPNPYDEPVTALVTIERAGIMESEAVVINEDALTYEFEILDEHIPNIYFEVTLLRSVSAENPQPSYIYGVEQIDVSTDPRELTIEAVPSQQVGTPDDTVSFDLTVTDNKGNPVQAEVGVQLTDEAVLALSSAFDRRLIEVFYGIQYSQIYNSTSLSALLGDPEFAEQGGKGGGGGGGGGQVQLREDFIYTPLWEEVVTDANGQATVSVTLPDNLTSWRFDARAVNMATDVGQMTTNITSTLPIIVRPQAPRFAVVDDLVTLSAVVSNNTPTEQTLDVNLQANGTTLVEPTAAIQVVTIPANGRQLVTWMARVNDVQGIDMTVSATNDSGGDFARPSLTDENGLIPVYRYQAPETVSTGGMVRDGEGAVEGIALPTRYSDVDGALSLRVDGSLASVTNDGLDYLTSFPHQCIEQTTSRFLPNIMTLRAMQQMGLDSQIDMAAITAPIDILVRTQNGDGGWGWFAGNDSDPLVSAYATLGLGEARAMGIPFPEDTHKTALGYVRNLLQLPTPALSDVELNRQAFYIYVLSASDENFSLNYQAMAGFSDRLTISSTAYLALAGSEIPAYDGSVYLNTLSNSVILSANGAHWEERDRSPWNWDTDTRSTALATAALIRSGSNAAFLPNAVRWLVTARRYESWETTQETAWAVMALTDWMTTSGELNANYDFNLLFNGDSVLNGNVTPQTVDYTRSVQIAVADMLGDELNRLDITRTTGGGALYYTADLRLQLPAGEVSALDRGVSITREYLDLDGNPIDSATVGDVVVIRLSATLPSDMIYMAIEDALPAGLEVINSRLATESRAQEWEFERRNDPKWFWGWWHIDEIAFRDEGAALYADNLPRGTYTFTYQARATSAGEFNAMPAQAYPFYQPDIFGRTDGATFVVNQ